MKKKELSIKTEVYNSLILGNSRSNNLKESINILKVMEKSNIEPASETYATLLQVYAEHGNKEEVIKILRRHDDEEIYFFGSNFLEVIYNLAEQSKTEFIPEILYRLKHRSSGLPSYINVITRLIHKGHHELAYEIYKLLPIEDGKKYMWGFFIKELAYSNMSIEKIVPYCDELKNNGQNIGSYENSLRGYLQAENIEKSLSILRIMKNSNFEIRSHYFFPIFSILKWNKDSRKAGKVIGEFKNLCFLDEFTIDEYIFSSLVRNKSDIEPEFYKLLNEGLEVDQNIIYSGFICGILRNFGLEEAAKFSLNNPRTASFFVRIQLLNEYIKNFDAKNTVIILRQMLPLSIKTTNISTMDASDEDYLFTGIRNFMIKAVSHLVETNQQDEHLTNLLQTMLEYGVQINNRSEELVIKYFDDHLSVQHKDLLHKLTDRSLLPKMVNLNLEEKLEKLREFNHEVMDYSKNKVTSPLQLIQIAEDYISRDDVDEANEFFNIIKKDFPSFQIKVGSILKLACALVKVGRIQDVDEVLIKYCPEDGNWSKKIANSTTYYGHVNLLFLLERVCEGNHDFSILQQIQKTLVNKNYGEPAIIHSYATEYYMQRDDNDNALKHYFLNLEKYKYASFRIPLLKKLIINGQNKRIKELLHKSSKYHGTHQYLDFMIACAELKEFELVKNILGSLHIQPSSIRKRFEGRCNYYVQDNRDNYILNLIKMSKVLLGNDIEFLYNYLLDVRIANHNTEGALKIWNELQNLDILPSDMFLYKLGRYLKSRDCDVPFHIPSINVSDYHLAYKMKDKTMEHSYRRNVRSKPSKFSMSNREKFDESGNFSIKYSKENQMDRLNIQHQNDFQVGSKLTNFDEDPRSLVKNDYQMKNRNNPSKNKTLLLKMVNKIKEDLISGRKINFEFLEQTVENLSLEGDADSLQMLSKYTDKYLATKLKLRKHYAFSYIRHNRLEEYLRKLQNYNDDDDDGEDHKLLSCLPAFITYDILLKYPDYFPEVEMYCLKQAENGMNGSLIGLLNILVLLGKLDEAVQIYKNPIFEKNNDFIFKTAVKQAVSHNKPAILHNCLNVISQTSGVEILRGFLLSTLINLLCSNQAYNEALEIIEKSLSENVKLSDLDIKCLVNLETKAIKANILFPYNISNLKENEAEEFGSRGDK